MAKKISEIKLGEFADFYTPTDDSALEESIKKHGILQPLIVTSDGELISGHRRLACARGLGLTEVPCEEKILSGSAEKAELFLAYNRYREKTPRDLYKEAQLYRILLRPKAREHQREGGRKKALANVDQSLHTREEVAKNLPISSGQLTKIEALYNHEHLVSNTIQKLDAGRKTVNQAYAALKRKQRHEKVQEKLQERMLQLEASVFYGDFLEMAPKVLSSKSVDCTLTSPPFKNTDLGFGNDEEYYRWYLKLLTEIERVTIDYAFVFNNATRLVEICRRTDPYRILIWNKTVVQYAWRYEPIFVYKFDTARYNVNSRIWSDVLPYQPPDVQAYPYQNPVELYEHLLSYIEAKVVLDPFIGGGTTFQACKNKGLTCIGFEIKQPTKLPQNGQEPV